MREIRMLNCDGGLKADENWISAEILWVTLQEVREIWRTTSGQGSEGQGGKLKPYMPFGREPMELF